MVVWCIKSPVDYIPAKRVPSHLNILPVTSVIAHAAVSTLVLHTLPFVWPNQTPSLSSYGVSD